MFGWKVLCDAIPTKDKLERHHMHIGIDNLCLLCNLHRETTDHVLLQCPFSRAIWYGLSLGLKPNEMMGSSVLDWMLFWIQKVRKDRDNYNYVWQTVLVALDTIWFNRNQCLWKGIVPNPFKVINEINNRTAMYDCVWSETLKVCDNFKRDGSHKEGCYYCQLG